MAYASLSRNGETLLAASAHQPEVLVFELARRGQPQVLTGLPHVQTGSVGGDRNLVAGGTWKGTGVAVWEAAQGTLLTNLPVTGNAAVAMSPDGEWLATSNGEKCRLWHTRSGAARWTVSRGRAADLRGNVLFSPDGSVLALVESCQTHIKLVALADGRELATLEEDVPLCFSRDEDTRAHEALARLCRTYWYPVYAFVRRQGHAPDDAQDLTQAFFAHLVEHHVVAKAHPAKGKFRSFLLTSLRHFLANERAHAHTQKRGGGHPWFRWTPRSPKRALRRRRLVARVQTRPANGTGRWRLWNKY